MLLSYQLTCFTQDFKELHKELHTEDGELFRIFYLSVPPFAYVALARQINKFCR